MRILVVDDDEGVRSSMRRMLIRHFDAEVFEASNGADALEVLMHRDCDLVLLDLQMPGIDGIKTLQAIRRSPQKSGLPVIMLTGIADETRVREALNLNVQGYMVKPVPAAAMVERLSEVLLQAAAMRLTERGSGVLSLRRRDRVIIVDPDPDIQAFMARQFSSYCEVETRSSTIKLLRSCIEHPPAAICLGGASALTAHALLLTQLRTHRQLQDLAVFALVGEDKMSAGCLGFDGVLPRTLNEHAWRTAARGLLRARNGAEFLETAVAATSSFISQENNGVTRTRQIDIPGVQEWLTAKLDFKAVDTLWTLTLITTSTSAERIERLPSARQRLLPRARGGTAISSVASAVLRSIRNAGLQCDDSQSQYAVSERVGPPATKGETIDEQWVVAPQYDVAVLVRLSERRAI